MSNRVRSIVLLGLLVVGPSIVGAQESQPPLSDLPADFGRLTINVLRGGAVTNSLRALNKGELERLRWRWAHPPGSGFRLPPDRALRTAEGEVVSEIHFFGDRLDDVARVLVAVWIPKAGEENRHYSDRSKLRPKVVDRYELRLGDEVEVEWLERAGYPEIVRLRASQSFD